MNIQPVVIVVEAGSKGGREALESIEGDVYPNIDVVRESCADLFDKGKYSLWGISDFMDFYNLSDDDANDEGTLVVADTFFGYVYVQES